MKAKTWYLGPLGDLRPLVCPVEGVSRSVARFGAVHEALSGARTMDVTGHRASYELVLPWLTPTESRFVEALHQRTVAGPFYLLDPLAVNRLTRDAAMLRAYSTSVKVSDGGVLPRTGAPAEVGVPVAAVEWSAYTANGYMRLPRVPVLSTESVTFSLWARADAPVDVRLALDTYTDASGTHTSTANYTRSLTTQWSRVSATLAVPAGVLAVRPAVVAPTTGRVLTFAAAQLEQGEAATEWDTGGGAPAVLVDQLDRVSPNYPRNDLTLTLLEA